MSNKITEIYEKLFAHYGDLNWWPAKTPYEVIVGAVLTQNTAWSNVEKALANFNDNFTPKFVVEMEIEKLIEIIRPAGFFNQKSAYLKAVTEWFAGYSYDVEEVQKQPVEKLRPELLKVKGIGQETADSILLYAFGFPTFVVDAYTHRLFERYPVNLGGVAAGRTESADRSKNPVRNYAAVKALFENSIPKNTENYNRYHALIVINAKEHCKKTKPVCGSCPLKEKCRRIGT